MNTFDGFKLHDGDECYVSVQDPSGEHRLSARPRKAIYRSGLAIDKGWDFEILRLKPECVVEVCEVWKHNPTPAPMKGDEDGKG